MSVLCCTSLTLADLPAARVLAETLRAAHPDWPLWALLVDRPPEGFAHRAAFAGFGRVLDMQELDLPGPRWLFGQERAEARAAARAALVSYALGLGVDRVACFAPAVAVFHPLASLPDRGESVLAAPGDPRGDVFISVRNDATGKDFARDWAARLAADPAAPLPCRPAIAHDPGWGVSAARLARDPLRFAPNGDARIAGAPLAFARFDGENPGHELWDWHARRRAALAEPGIPADWWHFARFADGTPIPPAARRFARQNPAALAPFPDPFAADFRAWLAANAPDTMRA